MTFRKVAGDNEVVDYLADVIGRKLQTGSVLWLVPGGSAIRVAVAVAKKLQRTDLSKLTVTLTDERFGSVGHPDSNWQQLHAADFHLKGALMVPVLHGHTLDETTQEFAKHLQEYCQGAAYCLAFLGIGPDGHTAGILPGSPAASTQDWAASYQGPDHQRITMTPPAIAAMTEVVVYAMGDAKKDPLTRLRDQDLPISEQPAQAIKKVQQVTIFNDQIGDSE